MNADTVKTTKKRSRFIVSVIGVCILLLAGIALQWGKSSSAPTPGVLICGGKRNVSYMTPEDAEATRKLLDNRGRYQHWISSRLSCGVWEYQIYYNRQIFCLAHLGDNKGTHVMYSTVDSDGKIHYVTSYHFDLVGDRGSDDKAFFRELKQKYLGKGGNSVTTTTEAFPSTIPDTLILGAGSLFHSGACPMVSEDAETFKRLLQKKADWNPYHLATHSPIAYSVCIGDEMYSFPVIKNDDGSYVRPEHPTIFDSYTIGTDGAEYLTTYEADEESMKEMWALLEKYDKLNS